MSYETPSMAIFQNRKRFHAAQKSPSESTSNWFKRLQNFIKCCEFSRTSEYMLIDKFVSGLSEADFETISQVPTWTIDQLILVVVGSAHLMFDSIQLPDNRQQQPNENVQHESGVPPHDTSSIKVEGTRQTRNEKESKDALWQGDSKNEIDLVQCSAQKVERPLTSLERQRKYINGLKEAGEFEEYKRKTAEAQKRRRIKARNNERELQIHLKSQRREDNRDKKRKRISKKATSTDTNVVWLEQYHDTGNYLKIESEIKQEPFSGLESDLDFVAADRLEIGLEYQDVLPRDTKPKIKRKATRTLKSVPRSNVVKHTFECYSCALKCNSLLELKTHLKIFHPVERRSILKCYMCNKTTINQQVLRRHLREVHCEIPKHKCSCCAEKFKTRGDLQQHLKQIHPDFKPFVCEVCGFSSRTKSELLSHTRTHTGRKDAKCDICGQFFSTSAVRNKHMRIHTGIKNHRCEHCGASFRENITLLNHLICIHGQGEKPAICEICGKRFITVYRLKLHSNSHTGDRPYECNDCGDCFSQPQTLKLHVRRSHPASLDTNNGIKISPNGGSKKQLRS